MDDNELFPCPFCGGEPERLDLTDADNFGGSVIACSECGASSPVHFGRKENLVDSWNRRTHRVADQLDPEVAFPNDDLLRSIHADVEIRGRKNPAFAVSVHHRNIVLSAAANALRTHHLLTWDEWLEHCDEIANGPACSASNEARG